MKKEKGKFEEAVSSKLYDFESNTNADDWDRIVAKLPAGKTVKLFPLKKYLVAAAAIAVLSLLVGGLYYFYNESGTTKDKWAKVERGEREKGRTEEGENGRRDEGTPTTGLAPLRKDESANIGDEREKGRTEEGENGRRDEGTPTTGLAPLRKDESANIRDERTKGGIDEEEKGAEAGKDEEMIRNKERVETQGIVASITNVETRAVAPLQTPNKELLASSNFKMKPKKSTRRRWGFGVGGGRLDINSNTGGFSNDMFAPAADYGAVEKPDGLLANPDVDYDAMYKPDGLLTNYLVLRKVRSDNIPYTTDIQHKMPISLGLGVNYYLNDRWTLQSGLVFTILRSDWTIESMATEKSDYTQRLNYLGIPLSASYRLGRWKRLGFYASAGGMVEYNIDGSLKRTTLFDDGKLTENTGLKMKEPLFSVNSKIGIVCPVWRFINVYAETGVSYYFDNKSYLKTIRSDKPFNVSLQAGISFGF